MINPAKRTWLALLLTLVAALSLLVAACGGDDDDDDGGNNGDNAEPTATETTDGGDGSGDDSGDDGSGDSGADFSNLSSEFENIEAKITYEFTTTDSSGTTTTTMTIYNKPPNSRTDYEDTTTGDVTTFIQTTDTSYICSAGQCLASPSDGAENPNAFIGAFASSEAIAAYAGLAGIATDSSEEEIAGINAKCFSVSQEGSELMWCFGDNGLLLLSSSKDDSGEFEMRATDVSTDVSDSDFEPPFDVVDLSNIGQ